MKELFDIISDPNTQWVLSACMLLGLSSGVIGSFTLLRKQSLIGDAMSHAALPGICIAFLLYGAKSLGLFMIGAAAAGLLAAFCISSILKYSKIKEDTALGLVLSVFFGFGIVLLTLIQRGTNGNKSGLDSFLFGKAASLVREDVQIMMITSIILLSLTIFLFKELKLLCFDPSFGKGLGLPMGLINLMLMMMVVSVVVIGLQAVGVVLMSAMLITPAISARYWTERLDFMVILAGIFGAFAGAFGTIISTVSGNLPTGPVIVLTATLLFVISLIFAPKRGWLIQAMRKIQMRKKIARENVLQSFYDLEEQAIVRNQRKYTGETTAILLAKRPLAKALFLHTLARLEKEGLILSTIRAAQEDEWMLTKEGLQLAYDLTLDCRLRDMMKMYENRFASYHIGEGPRLAEYLPSQMLTELTGLLQLHDQYPKLDVLTRKKLHLGYLPHAVPMNSQTVSQSKGSGL